jgi:hypothetical protein
MPEDGYRSQIMQEVREESIKEIREKDIKEDVD